MSLFTKKPSAPKVGLHEEPALTEFNPAKPGKLTRAEMAELKGKRKVLRKTLKTHGIKSAVEFESFAAEVGLALPAGTAKGVAAGLFLKGAALAQVTAASTTLAAALVAGAVVLGGTFAVAYVTETKGHFTVNLTADMLQEGYMLSETEDFENPATRLYTEELENVNAISIQDLDKNIATAGAGSHNGVGYVAYTFYIKNAGTVASNYTYSLDITSTTNGVLGATWVMLIADGEQTLYAQLYEDGDRENLYGYDEAPFIDIASDPELLYYEEEGKYGISPIDFTSEDVVVGGVRENMEPEEVHKYTVVVWVDGDDPQCTNDIMGGHAGFEIQFEMVADDELDLFKGLYTEDYSNAQAGMVSDGT